MVGLLAACRKEEAGPVEPAPAAWRELTGQWQGVMGGEVSEVDGVLRMNWGETLTAARWTGEVPPPGFELECEARRVDGVDFFFSATFPVRRPDEHVTLVVGGWGGAVVGISSIDGMDASDNQTTTLRRFETGRWYALRVRSEAERLQVWVDGEAVIDFAPEGHRLSLRPGPVDACLPFGLATWQTTGEVRGLRWRPTEPGAP